jgi:hypothetical protein
MKKGAEVRVSNLRDLGLLVECSGVEWVEIDLVMLVDCPGIGVVFIGNFLGMSYWDLLGGLWGF